MRILYLNLKTLNVGNPQTTYIGDYVDECMSNGVWQDLGRGTVEALSNGLDTVAITEETNVPQQIDWNLGVLQTQLLDSNNIRVFRNR